MMDSKKILFHADDFGRSSQISKKILECLKFGSLNSVSVIVNHDQESLVELKKLKNIHIRLHLNLTEIPKSEDDNHNFLYDLNLLKLMFLNKKDKEKVFVEIDKQIKKFIKIFEPEKLRIDGHEHVHLVPWIYKYVKKKFDVYEMRNSNENLMTPRFQDIINIRYLRNFVGCIYIKLLCLLNKVNKFNSPKFSGLLYSGIQDSSTIKKTLRYFEKQKIKNFEILVHPGFAGTQEKNLFKKKYYNFYISDKRKKEYDLCFSEEIKKKFELNILNEKN
jgi:predicted glycoside hydrolase/deacetylase ChbG (UPF0249 family)